MIRKKPVPDQIQDGIRFSEKIILRENLGGHPIQYESAAL
jgi:hypothetical protein